MTRSFRTMGLSALAAAALVVAGCGSSSSDEKTTSSTPGAKKAPVNGAKKGGTLQIVSNGDFIDIDCGKAYYQYDYMLCYATQRPLYSYAPGDPNNVQPDMAADKPEISPDGKTLTIKIRPGVKFSPPVNREVTSKDVKYGIERMFFSSVNNGYAGSYLGDIIGAKVGAKPGTKLAGLETPDDQTLVIKLKKSTAAVVSQALSLPGSAPVPEDYAAKYDAKAQSTYKNFQVSTGPYMIQQNAQGKAIGYKAGKSLTAVRNPNWDPKTDRKPAALDGFTFKAGNDPAVAAKQIYQGNGQVSGDFAPLPPDIKLGLTRYKGQLNLNPNGAFRYVAMNTKKKPFDNVNIRRAVIAVFDRKAMQLSRGGNSIGDVATHFIPPGIPGFDEAGGQKGPSLDYLAKENGDLAVAQKYMKAAGFPSGKYNGPEITMIGVNAGTGKKAAEVSQAQFQKLGFKVNLRLVTPDSMYSKFCQIPKSGYDVCPNVAWGKDFNDPQSLLDVPFNGENIIQEGNSNHALFDDPEINQAMDKAKLIVDPNERAQAWGKIDQQLMEKGAAIPWLWDKQPNINSKDVNAVLNEFTSNWDLNYTGLK